uniref:Non-specific serine/threonine protein kinase n=1 Tax=Quercus lobata TaxID=97700 RepID=A0A7N2LNA9_QUELO
MVSKVQKLILGLLCLLLFLEPSSQQDTLVQGHEITELVSGQGNFRLGFFPLVRNNYYLGIWYNDNRAPLHENVVWIANRDTPIFNNSGSLTIDGYGNLKISYNGGLSIVLYSGQASNDTAAALLENGNFVLREQSTGRQLWQSFDYPTDILLPGMKLGVNRKTGHIWSLRSWSGSMVPKVGDFTFGMDPKHTDRLVILWHGNNYWTSQALNNSHFNLPNWLSNFDYVSNENETYFTYSMGKDITTSQRLTIDYLGNLNGSSGTLVRCDPYYGTEGCAEQKLPQCRIIVQYNTYSDGFLYKSRHGFKFNESDILSVRDCEAKCLNNCSCLAYASTNEDEDAGCEIWGSDSSFSVHPTGARRVYMLLPAVDYKANRWWIWPIIVPVGGFIITLCFICYACKKAKAKGKRQKKQNMLIQELGGNARPTTVFEKVHKQNKDGQANHELQIFSFESIPVATSNFSSENKLGEGGFGLVYKGKLSNGQEIAIKRLSRNSGQGLVEFKNEAVLIAKLQHTNLAWQLWNEGKGLELIDLAILDESCPISEVLRCIHVSLLCVQDQATDRPTMLDVVSMLSNETLQLSPPKQPAFFINTVVGELRDSIIESENCSLNNVTISVMEAR